jgi:hypothetical protein
VSKLQKQSSVRENETDRKMNDKDRLGIAPHDEPLFVLRYKKGRLCFFAFHCFLSALFILAFAILIPLIDKYGLPFVFLAEVVFWPVFFAIALQLVDLLSVKEIRLYQDRIVRVGKSMRSRGIRLADARVITTTSRMLNTKLFCNRYTKGLLSRYQGILYYEDLADPNEIRKLNRLLAALSGRRVREFAQAIDMERLIKDGNSPRTVTDYAFDEQDLRDEQQEKQFGSTSNRAFLVLFFFLMLGACILWFAIIWRAYH